MSNICYVMMPYGEKVNMASVKIDFEEIYKTFIKPAIEKASLEPSRTSESNSGELLLANMFTRILVCRFAIADITFNNPNVYYELGIRHAVRPHTTIVIHEKNLDKIPFDLSVFRVINYEYDLANKSIKNLEEKINEISGILLNYTKGIGLGDDSPMAHVFKNNYNFPRYDEALLSDINSYPIMQKEDAAITLFEKMVNDWKEEDARYRISAEEGVRAAAAARKEEIHRDMEIVRNKIKSNPFDQYRLLLTVLRGYKDIDDSAGIIDLINSIPEEGRKTHPELDEKLFFAYKRAEMLEKAGEIINKLKSEDKYTNRALLSGLLASILKKRAANQEDPVQARYLRSEAIKNYQESFDLDPNIFHPGLAMLNLLYLSEDDKLLFNRYLPLVEYSVDRRLKSTNEYWALVSKIELEALKNSPKAINYAPPALLSVHAPWKREKTIKHLELIFDHKNSKGVRDKSKIKRIIKMFKES